MSFVLNETPGQTISESTRQRVLETAARLRYAPSAEARTLRRGRGDTVLFHLPPELPLTADTGRLIEQLSRVFAEAGLTFVVHPWSHRSVVEVWKAITPAAVVAWYLDAETIETMQHNGTEIVVSLTTDPAALARWIRVDLEDQIADLQVKRLSEAGHRRLAYAMPGNERLAAPGRSRLEGLRRACAARGMPEPVATLITPNVDDAAAAVADWGNSSSAPTGVCAHDDITALAVLNGMRRHGLTAPSDMAVIGVNDSPAAELADPALTMVAVDTHAIATYITAIVTGLLNGADIAHCTGPTVATLIDRSSV